jgi:hypothetical protein
LRSLAAGLIAALFSGGVAIAAPASSVVARLVTSVCMPMIQTGAFQPDNLPPGGRKMTAAEKAPLDMSDDLADWRYEADDDFVVVQIRSDGGCDVVTGATGGPNFLPALRRAVTERYGKPQSIRLKPSDPSPDLSYITYWVGLPPDGPSGSPPALALAVTYTKASAQAQKRSFYVGVITATRKPN